MLKFIFIRMVNRLKEKSLNIISKFKYELSVFLLLCIQGCIDTTVFRGMDPGYYGYYLADFSMGKTSRLLIGSFVNLLTDKPTVEWMNGFAAVVLVLVYFFTAVLIGRVIKSTDSNLRPCIIIFSLFSVSGAFGVYTFSRFFGLLDIYMYLFTVLSVVAVRNKMFRWLIPLFCIGGVLINYVYTIAYFPLIAAVLLYLIFTQEKKTGNIILFTVMCAVTVALMFYCAFVGKETATFTFEEMHKIMEQKLGEELTYDQIHYFDYYLYGSHENEERLGVDMSGMTPVEFISALLWYLREEGYNFSGIRTVAIGALPIFAVFWVIWIKCMKNAQTKPRKFVYLCFMLVPVFALACCILSTDMTRWAAAGLIVQFGLGMFMFAMKDEPFEKTVRYFKEKLKGKGFIVAAVWLVYASGISLFTITG